MTSIQSVWPGTRKIVVKESDYTSRADFAETTYEGVYLLSGQPIHSSGALYNKKVSFSLKIYVNCNSLSIDLTPATPQSFDITAPPSSSLGSFSSPDLWYWQRSAVQHQLKQRFTNPHPFSCTMETSLSEDYNGVPSSSRLNEIAVEMDKTTNPHTLKLRSTKN